MAVELSVFGHSSVGCNEIDSASADIAYFLILLDVFVVFFLKFSLFKDSFHLVDLFENILVFCPFLLELLNNRNVGEVNNDTVTDNLTQVIQQYTISFNDERVVFGVLFTGELWNF